MTDQATTTQATKTKVGVVHSDKRDKTRKVVVEFLAKHPKYGKFLKKRTVLQVHDENNESSLGDRSRGRAVQALQQDQVMEARADRGDRRVVRRDARRRRLTVRKASKR